MHRLAKPKLEGWNLDVVTDDILSYVTEVLRSCDVIVSTYALHHLTKDEKRYALNAMTLALQPGGHLVIGDLMFEDQTSREALLTHFVKSGRKGVAQDIEEEFFWDLAVDRLALDEAGFSIEIKRFSDLSWAFAAQKPPLD